MAQGINSTKTPARPSHEAIESEAEVTQDEKLDHVAMEGAKRAENRQIANEQTNSSNSIFSK